MKHPIRHSILGLIYILTFPSISYASSFIEGTINGHTIEVIEFKTDSKIYSLKIGVDTQGGSSLQEIMDTLGAVSGVNGVFECPKDYTRCGGKNYTINERYVNGEKIAYYDSTGERVVLGWDAAYKAFIFQTNAINKDKESEIYEGLANHPLLLLEGVPMTQSYWEKGLIDSKMKQQGVRNFICSTKDSDYIYFGLIYDVDIDTLALTIKELGCYNAINLDAGHSTAMIYNGAYISGPRREILDGVFIVANGINSLEISNKASTIAENINNKLLPLSLGKKIKIYRLLIDKIHTLSSKISTTYTDNNYNPQRNIVGKKTNIYNIKDLKKIFLLNSLKNEMNKSKEYYEKIYNINKNSGGNPKF